jgi:hypothetical protein
MSLLDLMYRRDYNNYVHENVVYSLVAFGVNLEETRLHYEFDSLAILSSLVQVYVIRIAIIIS